MKPPTDLGPAGRKLWRELDGAFEFAAAEAAGLAELCKLQDRLTEVRGILKAEGLVVDGRRHPLADLEVKVSGQFRMLWRTLRLDREEN